MADVSCKHWSDIGEYAAGACALGHEGGKPAVAYCTDCPDRKAADRGLGDAIARWTSAVGIKPCGGCEKRQEALNRLVPFGG